MSSDTYRDLIPVIVDRENAVMPDGFDTWAVKSVRPDLTTYRGYRWPFPGQVAEATNVDPTNTDACPNTPGDGLCTADTWRGMASGGIPARTILLVAYHSDDVLGHDKRAGKRRHSRVAVVALVDGERLLRDAGERANLWGANLRGANLWGANLWGANLGCADLGGADLGGADLRDAHASTDTTWPDGFDPAAAGVSIR